jgi:hypothetical protein
MEIQNLPLFLDLYNMVANKNKNIFFFNSQAWKEFKKLEKKSTFMTQSGSWL